MWNLFDFLKNLFPNLVRTGTIMARKSGQYYIKTHFHPREVLLSFDGHHGVGVCNGEGDSFDYVIVEHGFILTVQLNSERRKIKWVAIA